MERSGAMRSFFRWTAWMLVFCMCFEFVPPPVAAKSGEAIKIGDHLATSTQVSSQGQLPPGSGLEVDVSGMPPAGQYPAQQYQGYVQQGPQVQHPYGQHAPWGQVPPSARWYVDPYRQSILPGGCMPNYGTNWWLSNYGGYMKRDPLYDEYLRKEDERLKQLREEMEKSRKEQRNMMAAMMIFGMVVPVAVIAMTNKRRKVKEKIIYRPYPAYPPYYPPVYRRRGGYPPYGKVRPPLPPRQKPGYGYKGRYGRYWYDRLVK